jgi:hypothetical protein
MRCFMSFYPPYLGAGVRVRHISDDFRDVTVSMGLGWYNRNYVGTQFGGSLYSMVDPFYMLMLMENLGRQYIVWDKAADIDFISPGKGPRSVGKRPMAKNTCRNCRSIFTTAPAPWWRGSKKPFTCGSSRNRDRLKAWTCAQIC